MEDIKEKIKYEVAKYNVTDAALESLKEQWGSVNLSEGDETLVEAGREALAKVGQLRRGVEAKRKELKDEYLEIGRGIDAEAKRIQAIIASVETNLKAQIDTIDAAEKKEKALKTARKVWPAREKQLTELGVTVAESELEKTMLLTEAEFQAYCGRIRQAKIDEQQAEIDRLKREAKEREDAEQRAKDIEAAKVQAAADERARIEREQTEMKHREIMEAAAAEAKRKADAEAAEKAEAERLAALSDKARINEWARQCLEIPRPVINGAKHRETFASLIAILEKAAK